MNILAIADRPAIHPISQTIKDAQIDLVITLGDLGFFELKELQSVMLPKIGVYGNHCSGNYFNSLDIRNMHLQTWEFQGITFGGFQGCVRYKENPEAIMCTQEEASDWIAELPAVDVLLAHCPPYGINDDQSEISHTGFIALREYINKYHPKHFFHGHTYPEKDKLVTQFGSTQIHYVFSDVVITI